MTSGLAAQTLLAIRIAAAEDLQGEHAENIRFKVSEKVAELEQSLAEGHRPVRFAAVGSRGSGSCLGCILRRKCQGGKAGRNPNAMRLAPSLGNRALLCGPSWKEAGCSTCPADTVRSSFSCPWLTPSMRPAACVWQTPQLGRSLWGADPV